MAVAPVNVRQDNQGLVCDAVVRVWEERQGVVRSDVTQPERAGGPGAVDLLFRLGTDHYALEHTQIEAFPGQIRHDARFWQFISPVMDQLGDSMPRPGVYDLVFPLDTRMNARADELDRRRAALVQWVREAARELHALHPQRLDRATCPHGFEGERIGRPEGFPFDVRLIRSVHWSESGVHDGVILPVRTAPSDNEPLRRKRIETALESKREKLAYRKTEGARTVLALESSDMVLTNHALVGNHLAELLPSQPSWLDELHFIDTTTSTWSVHRWDWEANWWEEGYTQFDPRRLVDAFAR